MTQLILVGLACFAAGAILGWVAASRRSARRIADQAAHLVQANTVARTDQLTGLWNRNAFDERLQIQAALARQYGTSLSLILIDLDGFKQLNDLYGHAAGDAMLEQLAQIWKPLLHREADFLARWGGDEFAVLLPQTDTAGAEAVLDRIRARSSESPLQVAGHSANVEFSAGMATFAPPETAQAFVERADAAMYRAKRRGGEAPR